MSRAAPKTGAIHPTPERLLGLLDAFDLALGWMRARGGAITNDAAVLARVRAFVAGAATAVDVQTVMLGIQQDATTIYQQDGQVHPSVQAHDCMRKAIRTLAAAALSAKVESAQFAGWQELMLGLLAQAALLLGEVGAEHQLHVAMASGERRALVRRGPQDVAKSAAKGDGATISKIALGHTLLMLRERAKLTKEDCCARVSASGKSLTTGQLARIESGTASGAAPLVEVARVCGSNLARAERIAQMAVRLGADLARLSVGVDSSDWYADARATYSDRAAEALLTLAVLSAISKVDQEPR